MSIKHLQTNMKNIINKILNWFTLSDNESEEEWLARQW